MSRLEEVERKIREAEAERIELLAEAFDIAALESERGVVSTPSDRSSELAYRAVRAEVSAALHQSERTTERQLDHAVTLTRRYPRTFEAYRAGALSERHTSVIADAGTVIGAGDDPDTVLRRSAYEAAVLELAVEETPGRLRPLARGLAEQFADRPLDERHAEARARRRVYVVDAEDGMADLIAHLPAEEAYGAFQRLTSMCREIERVEASLAIPALPDEDRSGENRADEAPPPRRLRDEIRADLLADLLLAPDISAAGSTGSGIPGAEDPSSGSPSPIRAASAGGMRARVQIVIPVEALAEVASDLPGRPIPTIVPFMPSDRLGDRTSPAAPSLGGYGPIGGAAARQIAGRAPHWELLHAHPATGEVLSVDRYRPSERMRRLLGARDEHCRFPGCRTPVSHCDIDHTIDAAQGGPTRTDNLAHLCRGHHTLKHRTGWRVRQRRGGTLEWTSPTGRTHLDRPRGKVEFAPVETPREIGAGAAASTAMTASTIATTQREDPF